MAGIQNRKKDFFSHKESVREESLAPKHLETAGDALIKNLVKKQLETQTTLQKQLAVEQNFEKGLEFIADITKGVSTLQELKERLAKENEDEKGNDLTCTGNAKDNKDLDVLKSKTGLSRHELELSLCEKPNSDISKLYRFALGNKKQKCTLESLKHQLPAHPINRLHEIEEEYFGHLKKESNVDKIAVGADKKPIKRRRNHRKRRKKCNAICSSMPSTSKTEDTAASGGGHELPFQEIKGATDIDIGRPSLWDVKDMKKWRKAPKMYDCKPQTFYTILNGKIIKLENMKEDIS